MKQVLKTVTFGSFDRMVEYDRWIVPGQHCYTPRELKEMKEEVRNEPMMFFAEVAWASGLASMRSEKPLTSRDRTRLAIERCEEHTFKSKCTLKFNRANRDRLDALRKSRRSEYEVVVKAEGLRKERSEAVAVSQTSTCGSMRRKNRREQRQVDVLKREKSEDIAVTQISPPVSLKRRVRFDLDDGQEQGKKTESEKRRVRFRLGTEAVEKGKVRFDLGEGGSY